MKYEVESLDGYGRNLVYQSNEKQKLLDEHSALALDLDLSNVYLEKTEKGEKFFFEIFLSDTNRVRVGPIGAYATDMMAMWLNEQINEYVFQGTMGKLFPSHNKEQVKKLVGEMISGFKDDHLVVSFENKTISGWQPYAGVTAYVGDSEDTLWSTTTENRSSLSTFMALSHKCQRPGDEIFMVSEKGILEMSRLWKRKTDSLSVMGITLSDIGWQSMAFLALGMEEAVLSGYYNDEVSWVLYDTSRKIQESLGKHFGMSEVLSESDLMPTKEVLESVLAYHYGGDEWGGYAGKIIVGKASLANYTFASKKFLKRKNIFTNLNIKSNERVF